MKNPLCSKYVKVIVTLHFVARSTPKAPEMDRPDVFSTSKSSFFFAPYLQFTVMLSASSFGTFGFYAVDCGLCLAVLTVVINITQLPNFDFHIQIFDADIKRQHILQSEVYKHL